MHFVVVASIVALVAWALRTQTQRKISENQLQGAQFCSADAVTSRLTMISSMPVQIHRAEWYLGFSWKYVKGVTGISELLLHPVNLK